MPEEMIEKICKQKGAVFFNGCTSEDIRQLNQALEKQQFSPLPAAYANLLQTTNGLVYDGLEFLGTKNRRRQQKNYVLSGLLEINQRYSRFDFFNDKLILGELPESFILYDSIAKNYEITDRLNLDSKWIFNSFTELLKAISQFLVIK